MSFRSQAEQKAYDKALYAELVKKEKKRDEAQILAEELAYERRRGADNYARETSNKPTKGSKLLAEERSKIEEARQAAIRKYDDYHEKKYGIRYGKKGGKNKMKKYTKISKKGTSNAKTRKHHP
jgi:hypothetical protein